MSNYTKTTNFATKDSLPSGNPAKIVKGTEIDTEFNNISVAVATKPDTNSITGGTGIDTTPSGTSVSVAIDSTVATLTGTQTLTNKTLTTPVISGNLTTDGNIDGRDVAADGTKLDTVETNADVTDTTNVTAAGALMDSEVTNLAQVKAFDSTDYATAAQGTTADAALPKAGGAMTGAITTNSTFDGRDVATDGTKLDGIEALADVTDTANVTAAGALMDSELTSIASVKALNQGVATTDSPTFAAATVTGEITANGGIALGDNDKATFGAGDDLEIYHDGSNSYISEVGTGELVIQARDAVTIEDGISSDNYIYMQRGNKVSLFYAGAEKLATTATGIDVTGTATMDGLTVDSGILRLNDDSTADFFTIQQNTTQVVLTADSTAAANIVFRTASGGVDSDRLKIAANGDISFYEDTGTTPKLFWDASAERLGIGTSSPAGVLDLGQVGSTGANTIFGVGAQSQNYFTTNTSGIHVFRRGTTEDMRIDSSGNVGVGTSSPSTKLTVDAAATISATNYYGASTWTAALRGSGVNSKAGLLLNSYSAAGQPALASIHSEPVADYRAALVATYSADGSGAGYFAVNQFRPSYSDTLERMRIDSSGNVGIGVSSANSSRLRLDNGGTSGAPQLMLTATGASTQTEIRHDTSGNLIFDNWNSGRTERLRITSQGDLLVGTTDRFPVGAGDTTAGIALREDGLICAQALGTAMQLSRRDSDGDIAIFKKDGTAVGSIGTDGTNMWLGDTNTGLRFRDSGDQIQPYNPSSNATRDAAIDLGGSSTRFKDLYLSGVANAGSMLIGTTSAQGKLTLRQDSTTASPLFIVNAANSGKFATFEGNGAVHGSITWSGSTTAYNTSSDQRLKENIADADDAGSKIDSIQVRKYDWKADGSHQDYGMIAQELQAVAPEAVSGDADSEEMMGVDYSKLVPMLIKEIQSLRNRVAQLETGE